VQDQVLSDGRPVWHHVAMMVGELGEELVGRCGLSSMGAVVGATFPRAVAEARRLLPQSVLLLPGVGAQGATPADVARAFTRCTTAPAARRRSRPPRRQSPHDLARRLGRRIRSRRRDSPPGRTYYVVRHGDNFYAVSLRFHLTLERLRSLNPVWTSMRSRRDS